MLSLGRAPQTEGQTRLTELPVNMKANPLTAIMLRHVMVKRVPLPLKRVRRDTQRQMASTEHPPQEQRMLMELQRAALMPDPAMVSPSLTWRPWAGRAWEGQGLRRTVLEIA